jgi:hypothetical protein
MNVRFQGKSGHDADVTRCLLMTQNGHVTEPSSLPSPSISRVTSLTNKVEFRLCGSCRERAHPPKRPRRLGQKRKKPRTGARGASSVLWGDSDGREPITDWNTSSRLREDDRSKTGDGSFRHAIRRGSISLLRDPSEGLGLDTSDLNRHAAIFDYRSVRTSSTRRLSARPCSVALSPFGWAEPRPAVRRRLAAMPRLVNASATALARAAESF